MKKYQTGPRKQLLAFLEQNSHKQFTIEQLIQAINTSPDTNAPMATSTVYRLMTTLVEEGTVKRFIKGTRRQFFYQIFTCHDHSHLHMKCTDCGTMLHMSDTLSKDIIEVILKNSQFSLDENETLLFGRCTGCSPKKQP